MGSSGGSDSRRPADGRGAGIRKKGFKKAIGEKKERSGLPNDENLENLALFFLHQKRFEICSSDRRLLFGDGFSLCD